MRNDVQLPSCLRADGEVEGSSAAPVKTDLPGEGFVQAGVDWGWCGRLSLNLCLRNSWKPPGSTPQPSVVEMALPHSKKALSFIPAWRCAGLVSDGEMLQIFPPVNSHRSVALSSSRKTIF